MSDEAIRMPIKTLEDHRSHFIERAFERYGVSITEAEYHAACCSFHGKFKKSSARTIGWIEFQNKTIWCLYNNDLNCLVTAYPPAVETDVSELLRACFPTPVRQIAAMIYYKYIEEKCAIKFDYKSDKEAALEYFTNTLFPPLHMDFYKYQNVPLFKIMVQIRNVIEGRSHYLQLTIEKTAKTTNQ